jgi:uncharacterized protein DUF5989
LFLIAGTVFVVLIGEVIGSMRNETSNEFEKAAAGGTRVGLVSEFWYFLRQNKKWWLTPIIIILLLLSLLLVVGGGTAVAPFIYTLF